MQIGKAIEGAAQDQMQSLDPGLDAPAKTRAAEQHVQAWIEALVLRFTDGGGRHLRVEVNGNFPSSCGFEEWEEVRKIDVAVAGTTVEHQAAKADLFDTAGQFRNGVGDGGVGTAAEACNRSGKAAMALARASLLRRAKAMASVAGSVFVPGVVKERTWTSSCFASAAAPCSSTAR